VVDGWSQSPAGPVAGSALCADQISALRGPVGSAIVAMAAIVLLRTGAIPAHLWAARFVGAVNPLAVPAALGWGAAIFILVAAAWAEGVLAAGPFVLGDLERIVVILFALASVLLGGLAAILHDDLEHVLGYSIVQDAGVALLAFGGLEPVVAGPLTTWLIASAALKSGLAAWISVTRWAYGTHRLSELGGWARRAPLIAIAFAILLVGSVGIPGMAIFDARRALISAALPGWPGTVVLLAALSPLVALGRLLAVGFGRPSLDVAGAPEERVGQLVPSLGGWTRGGPRWWLKASAAVVRANEGLGAGLATALLGVVGLTIAVLGAGGSTAG
jgi:multicomponent Na+:H+ antiporter subunit A